MSHEWNTFIPEDKPTGWTLVGAFGPSGELVDVTDLIDREGITMTITETNEGRKVDAFFPYRQNVGSDYDIPPNRQLFWQGLDLDFAGGYVRLISLWTVEPESTTDVADLEREVGIHAVGNEHLEAFAPATLGTPAAPWPPGDGTPLISTTVPSSVGTGTQTVRPTEMHNIYAGKTLALANPDLSNLEWFVVASTNYTGIAHCATAFTNGTHTVTVDEGTAGMTDGMWLFMCNRNGHNPETAQISNVTPTTFDVTLAIGKSAGWLIMAGEFTADFHYSHTYSATTSATAISAGEDVVVTPGSMTNIYAGQVLTVEDGTDVSTRELVTVKTATGSTFTADFQYSHAAGFSIKAIPTLDGSITDKEYLADGWYQEVDGVWTHVDSLIDTCYNNASPVAYSVLKSSINQVMPSVGRIQYNNSTTVQEALLDLRKRATPVDTTSPSGVAGGGTGYTVYPRNMYGIAPNKYLWVCNRDGGNPERVRVQSASLYSFQAIFQTSKDADFIIKADVLPRHFWTWPADNPAHNAAWTAIVAYYDAAVQTNFADFDLSNATSLAANEVPYSDYSITPDGAYEWNAIQVFGENMAVGEFVDLDAVNALIPPRVMWAKAVTRNDLFTNDECAAYAEQLVRNHTSRIRVKASTPHMVDAYITREPMWGRFTHSLEARTPFEGVYSRIALTFPRGRAQWDYELADPAVLFGFTDWSVGDPVGVYLERTRMRTIYKNADFVAREEGVTYLVDASQRSVTVYLTKPSDNPTQRIEIKRIDSNAANSVSIQAANGSTLQ